MQARGYVEYRSRMAGSELGLFVFVANVPLNQLASASLISSMNTYRRYVHEIT